MTLEQWQDRLQRHFESLAGLRTDSGLPVFALEHGLTNAELDEISSLLRTQFRFGSRLSPQWLLWTVYATERGYNYAGDEYWPSFEEQTPPWNFTDHSKIVPGFKKFQRTFNGVMPSGPWASHFSIIAWPITHAILPKYLQHQFARALYDLRFQLASIDTLEPAAIGRLLAINVHHASTRFEEFLQQEELTGQIVLGLLGEAPTQGEAPIYPQTLQRIIDDLGRVRNARQWLRETQRVVTDRFKGIGRNTISTGPRTQNDECRRQPSDIANLDIRPSLLLRYSGPATWSVIMEVPSFRDIAALNADLRAFLRRTRCRLSGADDMKPAGWLLFGNRKAVLKSWPDSEKTLIQFERNHGTLDHLLQSECRLDKGPIWLFRIGRDGIAREISGRVVRPGHDYIALTATESPESHACMSKCTVACSGIKSFRLGVPAAMSAEDIKWLHSVGLKVARTIRVWPAGLSGRDWDGEGHSEWLTTETPCLGIVHDHPVDSYTLRLNGRSETVVKGKPAGHPTFITLPRLPRGRHKFSATATRPGNILPSGASSDVEGVLILDVRDPEPWVPGTTSHVGMSVLVEPYDPTLDDFWYEKVNVSILGPEGHHVSCSITLCRANGEEILSDEIGSFDLPVTSTTWSRKLHEFVNNEARKWTYLEAASARVTVRGDELGEFALRLERQVRPIRWACRSDHRNIILRLIDELGREEITTIHHFPFGRPAVSETVDAARILAGIKIDAPGGLSVAQNGEDYDAIVVSSHQVDGGLQGLGVKMDLTSLEAPDVEIKSIIRLLALWIGARLAGPLAGIRRDQVVKGLCHSLYTRMCGSRWGKAEADFLQDTQSPALLDALIRSVDRLPGFAIVLQRDWEKTEPGTVERTRWFTALASQFHACSGPELPEFALRVAGQPHRLATVYGDRVDALLNLINDKAMLLRGARLLALLEVAKRTGGPGSALPRWTWRS